MDLKKYAKIPVHEILDEKSTKNWVTWEIERVANILFDAAYGLAIDCYQSICICDSKVGNTKNQETGIYQITPPPIKFLDSAFITILEYYTKHYIMEMLRKHIETQWLQVEGAKDGPREQVEAKIEEKKNELIKVLPEWIKKRIFGEALINKSDNTIVLIAPEGRIFSLPKQSEENK